MENGNRRFDLSKIEVFHSTEQFAAQASEGLQIALSLSEKTSFEYDQRNYNLGYGDFFILNRPHQLYKMNVATGKVIFIVLLLEGYNQKLVYKKQLLQGSSTVATHNSDIKFKSLLVGLLREYYREDQKSNNAINAIYYRILDSVFENYFKEDLQNFEEDNQDDELFFQIIDYIDGNYRRHITLTEIAQQFYLSTSTLSKFFQKKTGQKFLQYVTERRLLIAEQKVRTSTESMIQIALDTGFPNVSSFNKAFKEKYQETPARYRKLHDAQPIDHTDLESASKDIQKLISSENTTTVFHQKYQIDAESLVSAAFTNWNHLINLGTVQSILQYGFKEQLVDTKNSIHFLYGRVWGLFDEDTISLQAVNGYRMNFRKIEKVIDLMLRNNLIPFLEIGDKPFIINRNPNNRVVSSNYQKWLFFESKDWEEILEAFLRFAINRWGREEVSKWHFELWKTNLTVTLDKEEYMKDGKLYEQETELYIERFNRVHQIIKRLIPKAKLGGCGLSVDLEKQLMHSFIERWSQEAIQPDFFSIYLYPMNPVDYSPQVVENKLSANQAYFVKTLKQVRKLLERTAFQSLPILVTEWNFSISNRNYLHDSCFKASFVLKSILEATDYAAGLGYWLLSDLYGDFRDTNQLIHGGAGLISKDNIKKPAFYAFEFLSQMGKRVLYKGHDILITKDEDENIYLLMMNYKHLNQFYFLQEETVTNTEPYLNIFEDTLPKEIQVSFSNIAPAHYRLTSQIVNRECGSLVNNISRIGNQRILRQQEIDYLRNITIPFLEVKSIEPEQEKLVISQTLLANEVRLVKLEKLI